MTKSTDQLHRDRMRALARFTESSFASDFPSPFGCAIYDETTG